MKREVISFLVLGVLLVSLSGMVSAADEYVVGSYSVDGDNVKFDFAFNEEVFSATYNSKTQLKGKDPKLFHKLVIDDKAQNYFLDNKGNVLISFGLPDEEDATRGAEAAKKTTKPRAKIVIDRAQIYAGRALDQDVLINISKALNIKVDELMLEKYGKEGMRVSFPLKYVSQMLEKSPVSVDDTNKASELLRKNIELMAILGYKDVNKFNVWLRGKLSDAAKAAEKKAVEKTAAKEKEIKAKEDAQRACSPEAAGELKINVKYKRFWGFLWQTSKIKEIRVERDYIVPSSAGPIKNTLDIRLVANKQGKFDKIKYSRNPESNPVLSRYPTIGFVEWEIPQELLDLKVPTIFHDYNLRQLAGVAKEERIGGLGLSEEITNELSYRDLYDLYFRENRQVLERHGFPEPLTLGELEILDKKINAVQAGMIDRATCVNYEDIHKLVIDHSEAKGLPALKKGLVDAVQLRDTRIFFQYQKNENWK